ncbi:zinc finger protein 267-like [Cydia pomonella]|uniref:zinc finger protein 267-like n=1 Tax=Cydia pomonella TaxID=82600 RepID=UPI002ADD4865|nr:zinc finger protein 267-like [Cydia pomonella]
MDQSLDALKVDQTNVDRDSNDNFQKLLFSVDIKVEKEAETNDDEDWCVDNFAAGNLLEPLFFTQVVEPQGIQCSLCYRYFLDRYDVYKHNLVHLQVTIINPPYFRCDICNSYFDNIKSIEHHMPTHNKSITNMLPYKPKAFNKTDYDFKLINSYKKLKTYQNSKHNFPLKTNYDDHETENKLRDSMTDSSNEPMTSTPTRVTGKPYTCNICQKTYSYSVWHGHMHEVHGKGKYTCEFCDMVFKCQRYLNRHLQNKHLGKRLRKGLLKMDVKCDQCDAVLQNLSALTTHRRNVHSANKHVCDICKSTLKCKSYLLAHMRRVHSDGKKHGCECGKSFKTHRYLMVHKRNAHSKNKKDKLKPEVKTEES